MDKEEEEKKLRMVDRMYDAIIDVIDVYSDKHDLNAAHIMAAASSVFDYVATLYIIGAGEGGLKIVKEGQDLIYTSIESKVKESGLCAKQTKKE